MKTRQEKSSVRVRGTVREVEEAARQLRRTSTDAESILWSHLRDRQLSGRKFRRQHPLGPFIVDFCCTSSSLVVEVDGTVHDHQEERDLAREERLTAFGYRVIRLRNEEVLGDLSRVLAEITRAL